MTAPETQRQIDAIRTLEAKGVTITTVSVDIADAAKACSALSPNALGLPAIRGVVHAAGVLDKRMLTNLDSASLGEVLRPKVDGALVLHEMFAPGTVDFFVLFSARKPVPATDRSIPETPPAPPPASVRSVVVAPASRECERPARRLPA